MICNNCKKEINETAMFCPNCGATNNQINNVENKIEEQSIINHPFNEIKQNIAVENNVNNNKKEIDNNHQNNSFQEQNIIKHPFNEVNQNVVTAPNMANNELNQAEQQITNTQMVNNNEINDVVHNDLNQITQPVTGNPTFNNNEQINTIGQNNTGEKVNIALAILSWFIPLVGIIIFFTQKNKKPKTAKICGITALINIIILLIITTTTVAIFFSAKNNTGSKVETITTTKTTTTNKEINNNLSINAEWKKYEFSINNHSLSLPCRYTDLKKVYDFKLGNTDEEGKIKPNFYTTVTLYYDNKPAFDVQIYNDTNSEINLSEGKIKRIKQTKEQNSESNIFINFPANLKIGDYMSRREIERNFGTSFIEASRNTNGDFFETLRYNEDNNFTTKNFYEIKLTNDIISELTLDNINY